MSEACDSRRVFTPFGATPEDLRRIAIWGFAALGILFRLRQYIFDRSLWYDEIKLALNITQRSPVDLAKPLDHLQAAPIGFLWLEKLAVVMFGSSEIALRLVPLLAGVGSVLLFVAVARKWLAPASVPIAVGLFAVCNPLIYFASEVKQYSTDVAVALGLYLMARPLEATLSISRTVAFSAAGAVAVWLSYPAAFVLAGLGSAPLWKAARRKDGPTLLRMFLMISAWSCSFLVYYFISLRGLTRSTALLDLWNDAFAPLPPSSPSDAAWYVNALFNIFSDPVGLPMTGIAVIAAIFGAIEFLRTRPHILTLLVLPIMVALAASSLLLYPFQGRLLLFIVPSALLLIACGLSVIRTKTRQNIPFLSALMTVFLFFQPLVQASRNFMRPQGVEEIRPVLEYVAKFHAEGDVLYCYYSSQAAVEYYSSEGMVLPKRQIMGVGSRQDWQAYQEDLDKLRGQDRVWVIFSHVWKSSGTDEELLFLADLDRMGSKLQSFRATGASVYLYDLKQQGAVSR